MQRFAAASIKQHPLVAYFAIAFMGTWFFFAPLGIRDVIWSTDPQGYNLGWGDMHLNPRNAAEPGYLWLNQSVWEGKQIVSRAWVEDGVK
jgi:hypothetical protein